MDVLPVADVVSRVFEIRGELVILDVDAARFFGTETKKLNQQITPIKPSSGVIS